MEGSLSQNSNLGLSFHFIKCRSLHFEKYQKVTRFFLHKIKTRPEIRNLRHTFLLKDITKKHRRFQVYSVDGK